MEPMPAAAAQRIDALLKHDGFVRRVAAALLPDPNEVDDVVQETWIRALDPARGDLRSPRAWLATVARNLARKRYARKAADRRRVEGKRALVANAPHGRDPSDVLQREELRQRVVGALLAMEEPYRSVLLLRFYDDLPPREVARRTGARVETVRTQTRRGLERLRAEMDRRYGQRRAWLAALVPILTGERMPVPAGELVAGGVKTLGAAAALTAVVLGVAWAVDRHGRRDAAPQPRAAVIAGEEPTTIGAKPQEAPVPDSPPKSEPVAPETPVVIVRESEPSESQPSEPQPSEAPAPPPPVAQPRRAPPRHAPAEPVPAPTPARRDAPSTSDRCPGGMVYVKEGDAVIGTDAKRLVQLLEGRDATQAAAFRYEAPRHRVRVGAFFMDRYEVTNQQYLRFLRDAHATTYDTSKGSFANLNEVAGELLKLSAKERESPDARPWRQLYEANRAAIWKAFGERTQKLVVKRADGSIDEDATAKAFRFEPLPRGLTLHFYDRRPPPSWPGIEPRDDRRRHPVRGVSYLDAERFAQWAGKHVPTEQEWEYAARGPDGRIFPWGDALPNDDAERKKIVNWNGYTVDPETYLPIPLRVDALPEGKSWCGCEQMLGNVAEWTSSWFDAYPGFEGATRWDAYRDGTIKVIRGGHAGTQDAVVLRCAARNFLGSGPVARPYPGNRFGLCGFRCAWYEQPGRNQLESVITRAVVGRYVETQGFDRAAYMGACVEDFVRPGATEEHHAYVLGRASSIVVVPKTSLLSEDGDQWTKTVRWRRTKVLRSRSRETDAPRIVLAAVHFDAPLDDVWVRAKTKDAGRKRGLRRAPRVRKGMLPAGTYLLTYWFDRLCLATPHLEFACFLTPEDAKEPFIRVVRRASAEDREATFEMDVLADDVTLAFSLPLGGKGIGEEIRVVVRCRLPFGAGELESRGEWRVHPGE